MGAPPAAGHQAEGRIEAIDSGSGAVSIAHGPVSSLKWPGMTMEFKLANVALMKDLKSGAKIAFEFVERQPGEWVITSVKK
jgi:Cu(I)/Ag(I) efflux system membrane fusion protein